MCMRNRCIYHSNTDQGCDYILHMMNEDKTECRRPCPAGAKCTVYKTGKKKRWNPSAFTKKGIEIRARKDFTDRFKRYAEGMTDTQMAEAEGASTDAIRQWRYKNGLPTHDDKRKTK